MRAGMWLEALAQRYRVALLVVPVFATASPRFEAFARAHAESVTVMAPVPASHRRWPRLFRRRDPDPDLIHVFGAQARRCVDAVRSLDGSADIEVIHSFRLYTAPIALSLAREFPAARVHLDLDDIESVTRSRLAALHDVPGAGDADIEDARRFAAAEHDWIPRFDRVYVCSELDAERLRGLVPAAPEVRVIPNAVRIPSSPPVPRTTHPYTFLFVGTLGYEPNLDAVAWFTRRVLPRVHARAGRPVLVRIVGRLPAADLRPFTGRHGVRLVGEAADLAAEYGDADAVAVPLRAGGGTRIKVLEAFAHRRPVVSTSLGVEGIEAVPGLDLLVADDGDAFADACLRLISEPQLAADLVDRAAALVASRYSQDVVNRLLIEAT